MSTVAINWLKVPPNTKVLVTDNPLYHWEERYLAVYMPAMPRPFLVFNGHNLQQQDAWSTFQYPHCKLAPDVEIKDEWLLTGDGDNEQAEATEQTIILMELRLRETEQAIRALDSITDSLRQAIAGMISRQDPGKHNDVVKS